MPHQLNIQFRKPCILMPVILVCWIYTEVSQFSFEPLLEELSSISDKYHLLFHNGTSSECFQINTSHQNATVLSLQRDFVQQRWQKHKEWGQVFSMPFTSFSVAYYYPNSEPDNKRCIPCSDVWMICSSLLNHVCFLRCRKKALTGSKSLFCRDCDSMLSEGVSVTQPFGML